MAASPDRDAVLDALRVVNDPDLRRDIVSLGFIKDLSITDGHVSFAIELTTPACPVKDQLREQATAAVRALPGVTAVDIRMTANVRSVSAPEMGRPPLPGVKNIIAVGAGRGGVGKTIVPAEKHGLQVVSMGFLTSDDAPVIWRGPMLHGAIQQFFREVAWKDLDYLIVDMPPGTGDVALSLSQTVPVVGSIVVTTPQKVSLADSLRAIRMYQKLNITPMGLVENMSYYACPNCHHEADIFGHGGGEALAEQLQVPFLGRLPVYQPIREGSDTGVPIVVSEPGSTAGRAFIHAAERTAAQVSILAHKAAEANKGKIPLIPVR